jgi:hypothetical protein
MPQNIRVKRFWTEIEPVQERKPRQNPLVPGEPIGELKNSEVHWVEYATRFNEQGQPTATNVDRVRALDPARLHFDPNQGGGEKEMMFVSRWEIIGPAYEAWKEGRDAPQNGTPLDLWPGLTMEQAEIFRIAGIRSIEAVRDMDSNDLNKVNLPNASDFKKKAALFLENSDVAEAAAREMAKDQKIADMERTAADMAERMAAMEEMLKNAMLSKAEPEDDIEDLRAQLDEKGITYHHKAGAAKLRELLSGQAA